MAFAFGTVVSMRSSTISEVTRFRSNERRCAVFRPSFQPATLWRIAKPQKVSSFRFQVSGNFKRALQPHSLETRNPKPETALLQFVVRAVSRRRQHMVGSRAGHGGGVLVDLLALA